jgi:hypothetical protein
MNTASCARPASLMEIFSTASVVCSSAIDDAVAFVAPDTASQSVSINQRMARGEDIGDRLGLVSWRRAVLDVPSYDLRLASNSRESKPRQAAHAGDGSSAGQGGSPDPCPPPPSPPPPFTPPPPCFPSYHSTQYTVPYPRWLSRGDAVSNAGQRVARGNLFEADDPLLYRLQAVVVVVVVSQIQRPPVVWVPCDGGEPRARPVCRQSLDSRVAEGHMQMSPRAETTIRKPWRKPRSPRSYCGRVSTAVPLALETRHTPDSPTPPRGDNRKPAGLCPRQLRDTFISGAKSEAHTRPHHAGCWAAVAWIQQVHPEVGRLLASASVGSQFGMRHILGSTNTSTSTMEHQPQHEHEHEHEHELTQAPAPARGPRLASAGASASPGL